MRALNHFKVVANDFDLSTNILAGSSISYKVHFIAKDVIDAYEELQFSSINDNFSIKLIAVGKRAVIDFPDEIDLKDTTVNKITEEVVLMKNNGSTVADIVIKTVGKLDLKSCLEIEPNKLKLMPSQSRPIRIKFQSANPGSFRISAAIKIVNEADLYFRCKTSVRDFTKVASLEFDRLLFENTYLTLKSSKTLKIFNKKCVEIRFRWINGLTDVFRVLPMVIVLLN